MSYLAWKVTTCHLLCQRKYELDVCGSLFQFGWSVRALAITDVYISGSFVQIAEFSAWLATNMFTKCWHCSLVIVNGILELAMLLVRLGLVRTGASQYSFHNFDNKCILVLCFLLVKDFISTIDFMFEFFQNKF